MLRVQHERESRGWSRTELARRARLNPVTVGQIESGRLAPYPSQLRKLARALGLHADEAGLLLDSAEPPKGGVVTVAPLCPRRGPPRCGLSGEARLGGNKTTTAGPLMSNRPSETRELP